MPALLEVHDLEKSYGPTRALQKVTFEVHEGERFGLLGPNGAGKTTLLSIVSGLLSASAGAVRLQGMSVLDGNEDWKRLLGIVPQDLAVYGELTARENLLFFGELYGMQGTALKQSVDEVLASVGLSDRANHRVHTFSGGMKRRLNLGCAMVHRPRLLLLDEPTVGVDPQSRNHIFEEVLRLNAAGVTIVYTTHYMEEVQSLCTRVGIIDHGQLIACDTLAGLLSLLEGQLHLRVEPITPELLKRLAELPDVRVSTEGERDLRLACRDVKATLVPLISLLNALSVELIELEMQEPNLERVFLHLTHKALRD